MILVEVYVPAVDAKFDFELDESARVRNIIGELCEMLGKKMRSPLQEKGEDFMLCSMDGREILAMEKTLSQNRISDGSKLLLV